MREQSVQAVDESLLIRNCGAGNSPAIRSSAFRALVERHQDRVFNTCLGFLHNREDAEDVSQEVFVEMYNSLSSFRGESQLSTWVYRIAVTRSLDHVKWKNRKKRFGFLQSLIGEEGETLELSGGNDHPGVQLEDKERAEVLFARIDALPDNQRAALTMHTVEGLSYQEIADVLGTSVGAVESLIFRARATLKKKLYDFYKNNL